MLGAFYILACWLAGNAVARFSGIGLSGNVIGMLLLFVLLASKRIEPRSVRPAARLLLGSMALFFVPFGVGLMVSYRTILQHLWAILAAGIVSTILVLCVTGWTYQKMGKKRS